MILFLLYWPQLRSFSDLKFLICSWRGWSLEGFGMGALWTYVFKRLGVWVLLRKLWLNTSDNQLKLQIICEVLQNKIKVWLVTVDWLSYLIGCYKHRTISGMKMTKLKLTCSLLISPWRPLIKSSILLQFKQFFFYSVGVPGLLVCWSGMVGSGISCCACSYPIKI